MATDTYRAVSLGPRRGRAMDIDIGDIAGADTTKVAIGAGEAPDLLRPEAMGRTVHEHGVRLAREPMISLATLDGYREA